MLLKYFIPKFLHCFSIKYLVDDFFCNVVSYLFFCWFLRKIKRKWFPSTSRARTCREKHFYGSISYGTSKHDFWMQEQRNKIKNIIFFFNSPLVVVFLRPCDEEKFKKYIFFGVALGENLFLGGTIWYHHVRDINVQIKRESYLQFTGGHQTDRQSPL